ncbi:MAG: hypothetical protein IJW49_05985 [Clostridia bacterium]|nr:hypothetical protein [Clostridia bacterium]
MFGSIDTATATGKGIFLIYIFMLLLMVYLWIRLLMGKREPEKGIAIMTLVLAGVALISLGKTLFGTPIDQQDLIEDAILAAAFTLIGVTEIVCYLKKNKKDDPME